MKIASEGSRTDRVEFRHLVCENLRRTNDNGLSERAITQRNAARSSKPTPGCKKKILRMREGGMSDAPMSAKVQIPIFYQWTRAKFTPAAEIARRCVRLHPTAPPICRRRWTALTRRHLPRIDSQNEFVRPAMLICLRVFYSHQ